jgi:hypothetical protein
MMLLQAYPKATEVKDNYSKRTPLHYACMSEIYLHDSSLEVLNMLISALPEAIDAKDKDGKSPSDNLI